MGSWAWPTSHYHEGHDHDSHDHADEDGYGYDILAPVWHVEGRMGITSNLLDEGYTMTNNNPSMSIGIEAIYRDWFIAWYQYGYDTIAVF